MTQVYLGKNLVSSLDSKDLNYDNTTSGLSANTVQSAIDEIVSNGIGSGGHVELTQEEYNALVEAGNIDPNVVYYITDGEDKLNASTIAYDNTKSNITSNTVQGALDELQSRISSVINVQVQDDMLYFSDSLARYIEDEEMITFDVEN